MSFLAFLGSFVCVESVVFTVTLLVLLRYYIHRKWQILKNLGIPHDPPSISKFGHMRGAFDENSYFNNFYELKKKHGPIYGIYVGLQGLITCHDTDIMRKIYIKEFHDFTDRTSYFTRLNGKDMNQGLVAISGKRWRRSRSALSPTFSVSKIKQTFLIIDECLEQTLKVMDGLCKENKPFAVKDLYSRLALDVIVSSALGTKVNTQISDGEEVRLVKEVKNLFSRGIVSAIGLISLVFPSTEPIFEKFGFSLFPAKSLEYVRTFANTVIEDRLKNQGEHRTDLLQLMLNAEVPESEITEDSTKGITRGELIGNAMLMIGAGFDNTANVLTTMSHSLAFHPEIQAKLQEEIDSAYEAKGCFDYETVKGLKYLDMCVNETMRLYPSVHINSRVCQNDTVINGLRIPKGMTVQFPVYFLAHDPDY